VCSRSYSEQESAQRVCRDSTVLCEAKVSRTYMLNASKRSAETVSLGCQESGSCRAAIAKLREDNAKLKEELLLENKFSVTPTSSNLSANIANLQDQSDVYTRKVWPVRNSNNYVGAVMLFMHYYFAIAHTSGFQPHVPLASGGRQFTYALTQPTYMHHSHTVKVHTSAKAAKTA